MNRQAMPIGRILGIPIRLDYSWFLIFALLTWTLAAGYYPAEFKNWPTARYWVMGAVTAVMLFVSVLLHELGHSIVARHYRTPVHSITLFVFGGVSQIGAEAATAGAEFWIAAAGPAVSVALAGLFALLAPAVAGATPLLALVKYLAYINGGLALFNLIPGFPLDGGRVLRAIVWWLTGSFRRATVIAGTVGRGVAYLFILFGISQLFAGNFVNGLWIAFIGWFLESAAAAEAQQGAIRSLLAGHRVSEAMSRNYAVVPRDMTLQELVDRHILASGRRSFIVGKDDRVAGLLTLPHITRIPRAEWPVATAARAMIPAERMKSARPDTDLRAALNQMDRDGVNQLPVMAGDRVLGILSREDVISFLRTLEQLSV